MLKDQPVRIRSSAIIGDSIEARRLRERIATVAVKAHDKTIVLITGESGTGKELVAQEVHRLGPRAANLFVPINCGGLQPGTWASDLLGHERGAYTSADRPTKGFLRSADKGTVFFDELALMPQPVQEGILRIVEDRTVTPHAKRRSSPHAERSTEDSPGSLRQRLAQPKSVGWSRCIYGLTTFGNFCVDGFLHTALMTFCPVKHPRPLLSLLAFGSRASGERRSPRGFVDLTSVLERLASTGYAFSQPVRASAWIDSYQYVLGDSKGTSRVILVEGETDAIYLRWVAELALGATDAELSVEPCGSASKVIERSIACRNEGRMAVALFDFDRLGKKYYDDLRGWGHPCVTIPSAFDPLKAS